jgi:Kdo2-lipid IVA lauroyltransferase/acyltransferase
VIIVDYLLAGLIWTLSLLPLRILYILSDILYFFIYYVYKYRKDVVFTNLRNSFPEKPEEEILKIARQYYKNLSDIVIEVIKLRHISKEKLSSRIIIKNKEVMHEYYRQNKKAIAAVAHLGNWEWVATISPALFDYKIYLVYKPLSNKFFNDYLLKLRSKFGLDFISFKQTYRFLIKQKEELNMPVLASDQTPTKSEIEYWSQFLNQETGFYIGLERIARSLDCVVVFVDIKRIKRGYYEIEIIDITGDPKNTKEFEITEKYIHILENHIIQNPDNWLWSHRRWKHKKPINNEQ